MVSDILFNYEGQVATYLHARNSPAPVYFYRFDYRGQWTFAHEFEEIKHDYEGVAHVDDIRFFMK